MNSAKFNRPPSFKDYGQRLNEENAANIKVEIDWWDECICLVLNEIRAVAGGETIIWGRLVDYCRARLLVLSREVPMFVDDMVLSLIRDLIFQYYGPSLFSGDNIIDSKKSAELGTKILVVSQLGDEILRRIRLETGIDTEPEKPVEDPRIVESVSLDSGNGIEEDHPSETHQVYVFGDYIKLVENAKERR